MKKNPLIKNSIFRRLTLIFSAFTIICITVVAFILYYYSILQIKRDYYNYNSHLLKNLTDYYDSYLEDLDAFSLSIKEDKELLQSLTNDDLNFSLKEKLMQLSSASKKLWISSIEIYIPSLNKSFVADNFNVTLQEADYTKHAWYKKISEDKNNQFIWPGYQKSNVFFAFAKLLEQSRSNNIIVILNIDKNLADKFESMSHIKENEMIFIYQDGRNLLFSNASWFIVKETYEKIVGHDLQFTNKSDIYIKSTERLANDKLVVTKIVPESTFVKQMQPMLLACVLIVLIFIVFSLGFTNIIVKKTTTNVYLLLNSIEKVSDGDFDFKIEPSSDDEIGIISQKFSVMTAKIKDLMNKESMLIRSEQKALMKALEARVNPHFLYNTLQAISGKAYSNKDYEMCSMISSLANTYRYCISGTTIATINDEIENVRQYISIAQLRYGERLQIEYDIDDSILEETVPRLCLQIPVENSIKYALENTNKNVKIWISVKYKDDTLFITVKDNGIGMEQEALEDLRQRFKNQDYLSENTSSTGLIGLYGRLKLTYGDSADILIDSQKDEYFITTLSILFLKGGQNANNSTC